MTCRLLQNALHWSWDNDTCIKIYRRETLYQIAAGIEQDLLLLKFKVEFLAYCFSSECSAPGSRPGFLPHSERFSWLSLASFPMGVRGRFRWGEGGFSVMLNT
jgi:hypothetical protein